MQFINKYLRNLKPYKLASHKIWSVNASQRSKILKLDWNEATLPPSPKVFERIQNMMRNPDFFNLYPSTLNEELIDLLSKYVGLPKENVQYFTSSDYLHEYICKEFISVGDPVLILGPSYDNFRLTCECNGADVYYSLVNEDFTFNAERFEADISRLNPAIVYICNPNNPTGTLHSVMYIESLLTTFPDVLFIIDEAYQEFTRISCKDLVLKYNNILITRTMSKAFALANFRVGYLIASKENIQFISRIRNPKNLSTIAQEAACGALSDLRYMNAYVEEVLTAKELFSKEIGINFPNIITYGQGGNFLLLKIPSMDEKNKLLNYLADNNIFVRNTMHNPIIYQCFRITIGTEKQMLQVITTMKRFYEREMGRI